MLCRAKIHRHHRHHLKIYRACYSNEVQLQRSLSPRVRISMGISLGHIDGHIRKMDIYQPPFFVLCWLLVQRSSRPHTI